MDCNATNEYGAVSKWECRTCGVQARKQEVRSGGSRWIIEHDRTCLAYGGTEDVGPVTSVNDPDNASFIWSG